MVNVTEALNVTPEILLCDPKPSALDPTRSALNPKPQTSNLKQKTVCKMTVLALSKNNSYKKKGDSVDDI